MRDGIEAPVAIGWRGDARIGSAGDYSAPVRPPHAYVIDDFIRAVA